MVTLFNEVHFWSVQDDDVCIKDTDYGVFKYYDKKDGIISDGTQSKKTYAEKRDYMWHLTNKRPNKLKDKLKEFEEQISQNKIVYCQWSDNSILNIMLNTGVFIKICVNVYTGDILKMSFDKYLVGKLLSECIADVLVTRSHLLCTYNDNRLTIVNFTKQTPEVNVNEKLSRLEPRVHVVELAGPAGRRLERRMSGSATGERLLIWWRGTRDEVYPWSPLVKDQDRANVHIYTIYGSKLELVCFRRTEAEPLDVVFDSYHANILHILEQRVSRRGAVTIELATYEVVRGRLQPQLMSSVPLQTHACCHAFSPDHARLLLGCIDGSVLLVDRQLGALTAKARAAFIPTLAKWHQAGATLAVANERGQIQWFDAALQCLQNQPGGLDEAAPANIFDFALYLKRQPALERLHWGSASGLLAGPDSLLLAGCSRGPLALIRIWGGGVSLSLTAYSLISSYIRAGLLDRALTLLLALDFNTAGASCLASLQKLAQHLLQLPFSEAVAAQLERALGCYYASAVPLNPTTRSNFGEAVGDLARRFFHRLLRHGRYDKAFCLAIDVGDHDLFMDLHYMAIRLRDEPMAAAALQRAQALASRWRSPGESEASDAASTPCSQCSSSEGDEVLEEEEEEEEITGLEVPVPVLAPPPPPPLPYVSPWRALPREAPFREPSTSTTTSATNSSNSSTRKLLPFEQSNRPRIPSINVPGFLPGRPPSSREIVHVHRTVSLTIPPAGAPPLRVSVPLHTTTTTSSAASSSNSTRPTGEKNVKFSDTVTAFIVPEISRNDKPYPLKDLKTRRPINSGQHPYLTDPKQELADSLPLCHPNDEYLKDFTPISNMSEDDDTGTKIKVVHFGMV